MTFSEILNQYLQELNCTAKRLSDETGISLTRISRYRNGINTPTANMELVMSMARAFSKLAAEKNVTGMTEEKIHDDLVSALDEEFDNEAFRTKLNLLIDALGMNLTKLAAYCNYSVSTISKVRLGKRTPRDPRYMAQSIAGYVVKYYKGKTDCRKIAELMGKGESSYATLEQYRKELFEWLSGKGGEGAAMKNFLSRMDAFDMDEFFRSKRLGKVHIPTVPVQLPTRKTYTGIKGMEEGVEAFLKATVLSRLSRDVILFNDHPLDHCMNDETFLKVFVRGVAGMILKGIRINIIHDLDRPFNEMMKGLESWIPMYMTGLVSPYYMEHTQSGYHHLMLASGIASMSGDAIKGYPESGRYYFSKANADVTQNYVRAEQLLSGAKPLVEIFRSDKKTDFRKFVLDDLRDVRVIKSIITTPPVFTISDDLLMRMLSHNNVPEKDAEEIRRYIKKYREGVEKFLKTGVFDQSISFYTKQELNEHPASLSLSGIFYEKDVHYSYDEYLEHIEETRAFAAKHDTYIFDEERQGVFRNIQINIFDDECVVASKGKAPIIHFVSRHPKVIEGCSEMATMITRDS